MNGLAGRGEHTFSATQTGTIIGTPAYMSPEQAEGKSVDARSDIFAFGAILYEMLAGRRAFPGTSAASILGTILHKCPDPINAPPALTAIVFKCLAKSPDDRFQSASDLLAALGRSSTSGRSVLLHRFKEHKLAVTSACALVIVASVLLGVYRKTQHTGPINSIAVLPLDIESKDPEADYISDGISASINNSLAELTGLKVTPNSVAAHYKGKAADFQKIGDTLGVETVLSGRVVQHGDTLSINIELDDVRSGKQIWGQQYTRQTSDLLLVQEDISKEVSSRLRSNLSVADQQKLALGSTTNPEAYQLFLKGQHYTEKFTKDGFDKGIDYLNQAIALDPNYSRAYSALAYNYINQDDWFLEPRKSAPKAREAALKAVALNETDAEAHVVLAIEDQWYEWDWVVAEREFKRAIELAPDSGDAHGTIHGSFPPWVVATRRSRKRIEWSGSIPYRQAAMETLAQSSSLHIAGTRQLNNCAMPSTSIAIIGLTIAFSAGPSSKRETCLKRSRRFNAAWLWKTTLTSGQVSATPTRYPETRQRRIRSSIIWKTCLLRGTSHRMTWR